MGACRGRVPCGPVAPRGRGPTTAPALRAGWDPTNLVRCTGGTPARVRLRVTARPAEAWQSPLDMRRDRPIAFPGFSRWQRSQICYFHRNRTSSLGLLTYRLRHDILELRKACSSRNTVAKHPSSQHIPEPTTAEPGAVAGSNSISESFMKGEIRHGPRSV